MHCLAGRVERVPHPPGGAIGAAASGGAAVGGKGPTGRGAAEAAGEHEDGERPPQRQDGGRGGRAAAT